MAFAEGTQVPVERSRAEIEKLITKHGAKSFFSGYDGDVAVIGFELAKRHIRFDLFLPNASDKRFAEKRGRRGFSTTTQAEREKLRDAEHRRRWRALALVIRAKLEAVATGITTLEEEFLAHVVVPGGKTLAQWALPQIAKAYEQGAVMPPLLGSGATGGEA